jgi:hypothetical protein
MDEALSLAEFADKVGTVFLGVALIYALWRQDLVFGKQFKECQAERDRYRTEMEARIAKMEADLEEKRRT